MMSVIVCYMASTYLLCIIIWKDWLDVNVLLLRAQTTQWEDNQAHKEEWRWCYQLHDLDKIVKYSCILSCGFYFLIHCGCCNS